MNARYAYAARLRARRLGLGLTQATVARRIRVSENTVSAWERGVRRPTPDLARAWARALGADDVGAEAFAHLPIPAPCGTPRGYKRHLQAGEVCGRCRKAWSEYVMVLRARRGERVVDEGGAPRAGADVAAGC